MTCRRHPLALPCLLATVALFAAVPRPAAAATSRTSPGPPSYSAAGLYNLANSYARAGKPGLAVLNYERARLLAPGDEDIAANEKHVRDILHLPTDPPNAFQRGVTAVNPTAMAWLGLIGLVLVGAALLTGRLTNRRPGLRWTTICLGLTAMALTACHAAVLWPSLHAGVIVIGSTPVLVSPVPMGDPLFVLPEAETVRVTGAHEGYVLIRTRAGRTGWVSTANLIPVVPRH